MAGGYGIEIFSIVSTFKEGDVLSLIPLIVFLNTKSINDFFLGRIFNTFERRILSRTLNEDRTVSDVLQ